MHSHCHREVSNDREPFDVAQDRLRERRRAREARRGLVALVFAFALAACSGNFSSGTGMPSTQTGPGLPPIGSGTPMPATDKNGMPIGASPSPSGSPAPVGAATYPIDDAQKGFACGQLTEGYSCTIAFNLPAPTPTPSPSAKKAKSKAKATATPSPSPAPSPTPSPDVTGSPSNGASASASPSPSPTPATITLQAQAPPKDAPKMVHIPAGSLDTVALMLVQLTTNGDFNLDGWANAQFTLPKSEVDGRGFALQLFQVTKHKKNVDYKPVWTFDKSTLNDTTLTFSFQPPKMKIAKGSTYSLVLYGDDKSSAASPSGSPSTLPSPSSEPSSSASESPSPSPSASP